MTERGLAATRSRARDLIRLGAVTVDGAIARKAGALVAADAPIQVDQAVSPYVSRGGVKLAAALDAFAFDPAGRVALDLGASTGGFTDVLLQRGARRVYAVDVGHDQLASSLAADSRVVSLERTNARDLDERLIPEPIEAQVADVSFISLTLALPAGLALTVPGAWLVALVKPQFELGPDDIGKGGILRDAAARERALTKVRDWITNQPGWHVTGTLPSPIQGSDGNEEFLIGARRTT